jgi:hypothetical protein
MCTVVCIDGSKDSRCTTATTLKEKKNHCTVKLLRGYMVFISLKEVCLKGDRDVFAGKQDVEEWFVRQILYEKIVIAGRGISKK